MVLCSKNSIGKSYYEVLSVKEDASYDEIRAGYKAAILKSHPDKLQIETNASNSDHDLRERFLTVQKAWEVLCNSTSRANYDEELRSNQHKLEDAADEVKLTEMTVETVGDDVEFFHQCRCGDYYSITSSELEEMGISNNMNRDTELQASNDSTPALVDLPCGSCSLKIRLVIEMHC